MQSNIFTRIRRLFTFARSREIAPDTLATVIDALKRLVPSGSTVSLDPQPITPADRQAAIAKARERFEATTPQQWADKMGDFAVMNYPLPK